MQRKLLAILFISPFASIQDARGQTSPWTEVTSPPSPRINHAMVFDSVRGTVVLFGGYHYQAGSVTRVLGDTSEWNGTTWIHRSSTGPIPRYHHGMAFDSRRGRVVLFGGSAPTGDLGDTWEWDGMKWLQRAASGPHSRYDPAMAYDPVRDRTVLFGGAYWDQGDHFLGDTWEWDGVSWTQVSTGGPAPRRYPVMAYDSARGQMLLYGGVDATSEFAELWNWDGTTWTLINSDGPPQGWGIALAFDSIRAKLVLTGGQGVGAMNETWEWDGQSWSRVAALNPPPGRNSHAMAFDAVHGRTVMFGGWSNSGNDPYLGDTWLWDGNAWSQASSPGPEACYGPAMTYDTGRQRTILFGGTQYDLLYGTNDTWEWDGTTWTKHPTMYMPLARYFSAMAFDSIRNRTVMFGGFGGASLNDTWEWNGSIWTQVADGPDRRLGHAMVFDAAKGKTVLFGGLGNGYENDTWEWDGKTWILRSKSGPAPRYLHAMTYDSARARIVLFGGGYYDTAYHYFGDTWEWDGFAWTLQATEGPAPRLGHSLVFDSSSGRAVLFGGTNHDGSNPYLSDTWEWDGKVWTLVASAGPSPRAFHGEVFDGARGRIFLFGGRERYQQYLADMWEYHRRLPASRSPDAQ